MFDGNTLAFWDRRDKDFELTINLGQHTREPQSEIFFSRIYNEFVTVERATCFNVWDLDGPGIRKRVRLLEPSPGDSELRLLDFLELTALQLFLITTSRNEIIIYDTRREFVVLSKALRVKKINAIVYSQNSHAIILVTHDNNLPVFKLESKLGTYEINFVGWLIGHLNFVRSGCLIEALDCLITIDEGSIVKFWSLRDMLCLRTVDIKRRSFVKKIFFIPSTNSLAIISKKINIFKLSLNQEQPANESDNRLISAFLDTRNALIMVFRRFDYVIVCAQTGRVKKVFDYGNASGGRRSDGAMAHSVIVAHHGFGFYLGDSEGHVKLFDAGFREKKNAIEVL